MNVIKLLVASGAVLLAAVGCSANHNTAFRDFNVDDGSGAMVDIKQRAVIVAQRTFPDSQGDPYTQTIVCAEPSPDALSAFAAEFAAEGGNGKVGASLAAASQESAAFVGLRTQSIQLLRDSFYRACEGYMSGALTELQFDILTRRYQRYMVALLGIEQLTGAVRAPSVIVSAAGQASAAQSISSLRAQKTAVDEEIRTLNEEKVEKQGIVTGNAPQSEKDKATSRIAKIDKKLPELEKDSAALESGIQNARGVAAGGVSGGAIGAGDFFSRRSDESIEKISSTVSQIVNTVLETDDLTAFCIAFLGNPQAAVTAYDDSGEFGIDLTYTSDTCKSALKAYVKHRETANNQRTALLGLLQTRLENATPAEAAALLEAYAAAIDAIDHAGPPLAR